MWNQALRTARPDWARTDPNWPPDLIDLDDGTIFAWEPAPAGGGEPGYSHSEDHDFAWPCQDLETQYRLAEVRALDQAELDRLSQLYCNPSEGE